MSLPLRLLLALLAGTATIAGLRAADSTPPAATTTAPEAEEQKPKTFAEYLERSGVKLTHGPAKVALGSNAEFNLSAGEHFVGTDSLDLYCKITQNFRNPEQVGVIVADAGWALSFRYEDTGYVKDDEKDKLDADELLKSMREGILAGNEERKKKGWDEMRLEGWAQPPRYDEKTHNLRWALRLASSSDGYKENWINESIRLLGRGGVMNVVLITDNADFAEHSVLAQKLLAQNFSYVSGQKYAEFKQGDKVAAYGLSALVLGGGLVAAAKMGWLAKLWKPIAFGVLALGAWIAKMFRKITGRAEPPSQS